MSLAFLNNITLASNEEVKPAFISTKTPRATADKNPEGQRIRLFKSGAVYPSKELVEQFSLEYVAKDSVSASFGFDIVSSKAFPNTSHLADSFIIIAVVPKSEPKVDLFGSTKFYSAEDMETAPEGVNVLDPKSSVLTQGTASFGKEVLIGLLKEVYGFEFKEDQKFVDLEIVDQKLTTNDGTYFIPKTITRGEKKGQSDVAIRKNIDMFPLVLAEMLTAENGSGSEGVETTETEVELAEEANVPEIDMTNTTTASAVEPSIDEILDEEESATETVAVETEEASLEVGIDIDNDGTPVEEEETSENVETESGDQDQAAGEEEEFGGINI